MQPPVQAKGIRQSYDMVAVRSRSEWRQWLTDNHQRPTSIWLVTFKKGGGRRTPSKRK